MNLCYRPLGFDTYLNHCRMAFSAAGRSVGLRDQGEPLGSDTYLNHGRMGHLAAARGAGWQRQQHRVPKQGVLRPRSIWRQRLRIQAHGFDNGVPSACSTQQTVCQLLSAAPIIESPGLCDEHCLLNGSDNLFILACVEVTIISRHVYRWALFLNDQGSGTSMPDLTHWLDPGALRWWMSAYTGS